MYDAALGVALGAGLRCEQELQGEALAHDSLEHQLAPADRPALRAHALHAGLWSM